MANLKIKAWKILWLSDDDIYRPPVVKKIKGTKKAEIEGDPIANVVENDDTEDGEKIGTLQAFHGVGTRGLFYFFAEH